MIHFCFFFPASSYDLRFSSELDLLESDFFNVPSLVNETMLSNGTLLPKPGGTSVSLSIDVDPWLSRGEDLYFGLMVTDDTGLRSGLSNLPSVFIVEEVVEETGLTSGQVAGIVIASTLGLFILVTLAYFFAIRKKKK